MLTLTSTPLIMGILNVTPDSFSDGGRWSSLDNALTQAERMISEGADIIDIGGESTRPGSEPVSVEEQCRRVVPIITALHAAYPQIPISIDTTQSAVADTSIAAGASIINDVSAGLMDPLMFDIASRHQVPIILMHMQGTPQTMQQKPHYEDAVEEILLFLKKRIQDAIAAGIHPSNILIDPGIGFGKRREDNLQLIAGLKRFVDLGYPVMLGTSRKRFMGHILNLDDPSELVTATAVTTALGVVAGVHIFRVHDVKPNREAADLTYAILEANRG